jgi:hypothetical protein
MSPVDLRFNERSWISKFSDTANTALRSQSDEVARRIITLITGAPTGGDITPPDVPTNLEAVAGVESVVLSWTASTALDVERYRVQRSLTTGMGFTTLTETLDTTLIDSGLTGGTEYFYQVAAIDDSGNVSAYTGEVSATPTASGGSGTPPDPPMSVTAESGLDGRVLVRWDIDLDPTIVHCSLHRDTSTGGPYTTIASGITGEAYLDQSVINGTEYFYVLTSFNSNGDESVNSLEVSATPEATVNANPDPVAILSTTQGYLSVKLTWSPSTDTDFALYRIKYGTVTTVYTEEIEVADVQTTSYQVTGLDMATEYFFVIEVEDTAGNLSTESDEEAVSTFDSGTPIVPVPPAAPSNFHVTSETSGVVAVTWTPNTENDVEAYILFRNFGTNSTAFAPVGSRQHPLNTFSYTGLTNGQTYTFRILAQNTAGLLSGFSTTFGTPTANPGTGIPPGGGTGTTGSISGDTGLGALHKAPGATFDVLLNCSGGNFLTSPNMWGLIASAIEQFYLANSPPYTSNIYDWTNKRVAILLPEREFNVADTFAEGVRLNDGLGGFINVTLPQALGIQWHFIAPWPTASLADTSAQAKAADKKFQLLRRSNTGLAINNGGGATLTMTWNGASTGTRFGWWFCEFQANGRETIGIPNGTVAPGFLTLYGCDFYSDIPFSPNGVGYPEDTISTYNCNIDNVHYCNFDNPWANRHHVYERNQGPVGDAYVTETTFDRCGGQVWQQTRRASEGPDHTNGAASAGNHYWINCTLKNFGRCSNWSSAALTQYGSRRDIDMDGCVIVNDLAGRYGTAALPWPPPDPYAYVLPAAGYYDTRCSDLVAYAAEVGAPYVSWHSTAGHACGGFRMRDCDVYIRNPQSGICRIWHGTEIDIEDCSLLTATTATEQKAAIFCYQTAVKQGQTPPAFPVLSVHLEANNTAARRTAFVAAHPEVPANALLTTSVLKFSPPPVAGTRSSFTTMGNATQTIDDTNLL